jgi:DNA polymerase gamma 1
MSMHIAVSGFTSYQRALWMAKKAQNSRGKETKATKKAKSKMMGPPVTAWMHVSSRNSLSDVYQLYVKNTDDSEGWFNGNGMVNFQTLIH